jgi:hypothetical protein
MRIIYTMLLTLGLIGSAAAANDPCSTNQSDDEQYPIIDMGENI